MEEYINKKEVLKLINATNGNIFCLFNKVSRVIELRDCVEVEVEVRPNIIWTSQFDKEWWNTKWEGVQDNGRYRVSS